MRVDGSGARPRARVSLCTQTGSGQKREGCGNEVPEQGEQRHEYAREAHGAAAGAAVGTERRRGACEARVGVQCIGRLPVRFAGP